ncbi:MAG: FecR domain-containing protein [Gammaproteobacteria bacterium]
MTAALILVLVLGTGGFLLERNGSLPWQVARYQTGVGERWLAKLSDGTTMTLDGSGELEVRMLRSERRLRLLKGRAFFEVAKDPTRPFVVLAGDRRITSVGTVFEASLAPDTVRVLTVEGQVAVARVAPESDKSESSEPPLQVLGGEQLLAPRSGTASVSRVDVQRLTEWQSGRRPDSATSPSHPDAGAPREHTQTRT